jgi:CubicO group peptidase (beta-lactamase class C family)
MTILEQAIQAVEHGLVTTRKPGERKRDLLARMQQYKVPGFSVALIDREEIAWVNGFGPVEIGREKPVTPDRLIGRSDMLRSPRLERRFSQPVYW